MDDSVTRLDKNEDLALEMREEAHLLSLMHLLVYIPDVKL